MARWKIGSLLLLLLLSFFAEASLQIHADDITCSARLASVLCTDTSRGWEAGAGSKPCMTKAVVAECG